MSNAPDTSESIKTFATIPVRPSTLSYAYWVWWVVFFSVLACLGGTQASEAVADGTDPADPVTAISDELSETTLAARTTQLSTDAVVEAEVHCLALNIYFEARSEPELGQRAVGHVVMNRVAHPGYPDSVCKVVQQGGEEDLHRCQFSWWCDGQSDKPLNRKAWDKAERLAYEIYLGLSDDATDGALWYHATYVKPYWSELLRKGDRIGQHIFYLDNRRPQETL